MEVAGVVFGAVPLILYALDSYKRAWEPVMDFWRWDDTIMTIRNNMFLQKQQLDTTLAILNLKDPTLDEVERALLHRFPEKCEDFMAIIREMDSLINQVAGNLYPDAQGQPCWEYARSDRVNWEWRRVKRSFKRKERKEIFEQLHNWNMALQNCGLEKREVSPDSEHRVVNHIRSRFDDQRISTIRESAQAIYKALRSSLDCTCSYPHQGNLELNWHDSTPPAATVFSVGLSISTNTDTSWKIISMRIEKTNPPIQSTPAIQLMPPTLPTVSYPSPPTSVTASPKPRRSTTRQLRFLDGPFVRECSESRSSHSSTSPVETLVATTPVPLRPSIPNSSRINLCRVLQSSQADHPVLGYIPIPDSESYQKLCIETIDSTTAMNSNIIARKRTVDLNSLLSGTFDPVISRHLGLTRKQRFGIAAALAWAVLHLCDSPWLEKEKLCGDEIQMFLESQNRGPASHLSTYPYLSCRFRLPDSGTRTTTTTGAGGAAAAAEAATGSQNNEEEFQNKQVQNITLFTLAIRLIELGLNMSFSEVRERNYPISTCSTPRAPSVADDYDVAKYQVERLCRDPGRTYADAADRCLRFLFPGPEHMNNFGYDGFRKSFYEDVVAPIQATYELIPGSCSGLLL